MGGEKWVSIFFWRGSIVKKIYRRKIVLYFIIYLFMFG